MRIKSLLIENFRAVKRLELDNLDDMIVIAGSNGCGKTQIYHALRLLKSTYGGYQPNEYQQWWGEFQIDLNRPGKSIYAIFRDLSKPVRVRAVFQLSEVERTFLLQRAESLIRARAWSQVVPGTGRPGVTQSPAFARAQRQFGKQVEQLTAEELKALTEALERPDLVGDLTVHPRLEYAVARNPALEVLFSIYEPTQLGVIDYHGAHRTYNRERFGNVNLNIEQSEERSRQHALYNWSAKYSNIKSELAAGYVRDLIAEKAGVSDSKSASLTETLQELFATFFPGKHFPGPVPGPNGTLDFQVQVEGGAEHDIDDLSSGEKEVLFGYLRLRNSAPKNSVILIDEPELHLNPALLRGLPQFYHKHIGRDLGNQLWLVTHSDALLRESVGQPGFSVFHMQLPDAVTEGASQLQAIQVGKLLDRAVVDLVGDLATYQPDGKVVIFEGGGNSDFDVRMTASLFPELLAGANAISAGSRGRVQQLHDLLRKASDEGTLGARFYSIVDRDSGPVERAANAFTWDRYHIENYLLEPRFILAVLQDLDIRPPGLRSTAGVRTRLARCAQDTLSSLVRHELETTANQTLVSAIKTRTAQGNDPVASDLHDVIRASIARIDEASTTELSLDRLVRQERISRNRFAQHLKTNEWLTTFRGRDVLKHFTAKFVPRVSFEVFRDLVLAKMREASFRPAGMLKVVNAVLDD